MSLHGQCPRGHDLAENAVYCTVCWIRVAPEDPARVAARRRRQRRLWFPLFGATAVVLGVVIGGTLGQTGGITEPAPAPVAAAPIDPSPVDAAPAGEPAADQPSAAAEAPESVSITPLAATIAEPTSLAVCVPAATATLSARTRDGGAWSEVESRSTVGSQGQCAEGEAEAQVYLVEPVPSGTRVRVIAVDESGNRLSKQTVVTAG